jgi:serine/threonine protein kinase
MQACPEEEVLVDYVARALDAEARRVVEAHLDGCQACLASVSELARADDELAGRSGEAAAVVATEAPAELGRYRLEGFLGHGAMGRVYRAYDTQLERDVALKVLRADGSSKDATTRLLREARAMAKLRHPNVVTVFDAGEASGRTFLAMELVVGSTLRAWLKASPRATVDILRAFVDAGRGLSAAHGQGVVHRDFKPENVLVDEAGRLAVSDFGLAAMTADPTDAVAASSGKDEKLGRTPRTRSSMAHGAGTPRYMAPEQYAGGRVDARADQFSFAVALYEALYDETPFAGGTLAEVAAAIDSHDVRPPRRDTDVPPGVRAALLRALSASPDDRYATLDDLLARLRAEVVALEASAHRRGSVLRSPSVAVVVALVVLAVFTLTRALARPGPARTLSPVNEPRETSRTATSRAHVLIAPGRTPPGETLLEPTLDAVLQLCLYASPRLDVFGAAELPDLASELGVPDADVTQLARAWAARGEKRVLTARLSVDRDLGRWSLRLEAAGPDDAFVEEALGSTDDSLLAETRRLSLWLRAALGDDSTDAPVVPASLEAAHEWAVAEQALTLSGDLEAARMHAARAVEIDPRFAQAHAALARAAAVSYATPVAAREYARALDARDRLSEHEQLVLLGDQEDARDRHIPAIAFYEQVLSRWPEEALVERRIVRSALSAQDVTLTLTVAKRAATEHPNARTREQLVAAYLNDEAIDAAADEGEALLADGARTAPVFIDTAVAEALRGRLESAEERLREFGRVDEEYADEARADLLAYEGRLDDARALLEKWIATAVAHHDLGEARTEYLALAELLLRQGDKAGARAAALAAWKGSGAEDALAHEYEIARALVEAGEESHAEAQVAAWRTSVSADARMYGRLLEGDIARARGRWGEALAAYSDAQRAVDTWIVHLHLGEAYEANGDWAAAERELGVAWARRGEGALFEMPSLRFLPPVLLGLARAREKHGSPAWREADELLARIAPDAQHDPITREARRRLSGP